MKIIREGRPKNQREHRATCRECHCEFSFNALEGKYETDQREGGGFWRLKCPQKGCGAEVIAYDKS